MTQAELETYFSKRLRKKVKIIFTNNRVRLASYKKGLRSISLRLHRELGNAESGQLEELVAWMKNPRNKPGFIKEFASTLNRNTPSSRTYKRPVGEIFDLNTYLQNVKNEYFCEDDLEDITISWGRKSNGKRVKTRKLGSYRRDTRQILIHPVLDDKRVPEMVIEFMIYHELLHAIQPDDIKRPHNKAFREQEQAFAQYDKVMEWQEEADWIMS